MQSTVRRIAIALACLALSSCNNKDAAPKDDTAPVADNAAATADSEKPAANEAPPPPPCKQLLNSEDVKEACGFEVTFADVELQGQGKEYRCEAKGFAGDDKTHFLSFSVVDMGTEENKPVEYKEKAGVSRFAGGQSGRYQYSVTEGLVGAPDGAEHKCSEEAVTTLATTISDRLP